VDLVRGDLFTLSRAAEHDRAPSEGLGQPPIDVDTAAAPVAAPVGGAE